MLNGIKNMVESIRNTLTKSRKPPKKFEVNPQHKFIVHGSSQIQSSTANDASGEFIIAGSTRPKQCPLCRSQDQINNSMITRSPSKKWQCKSCEHEWK